MMARAIKITELMPHIDPDFVKLFMKHYNASSRLKAASAYRKACREVHNSSQSVVVPSKHRMIVAACVAYLISPQHFANRRAA